MILWMCLDVTRFVQVQHEYTVPVLISTLSFLRLLLAPSLTRATCELVTWAVTAASGHVFQPICKQLSKMPKEISHGIMLIVFLFCFLMSLLVWIARYLSLTHSLFYILNPTAYETLKQLGHHPSYICFKLYSGCCAFHSKNIFCSICWCVRLRTTTRRSWLSGKQLNNSQKCLVSEDLMQNIAK